MDNFLLYLVIAVVASIFCGRVLYRVNRLAGFVGFMGMFIGIVAFGIVQGI